MAKQPIIFDFGKGTAYRATEEQQKDLAQTMARAAKKRRVVKRVEGLPPQVVRHKT